MQKILTAEEMREVDRLTMEKYGIPSIILMENAAHAAARVITEKLGGSVAKYSFLILCGKGNNGGDGAALARILSQQGAWVRVYLFGKIEDTKGDARINFEILEKLSNSEDNNSPDWERLNFTEDAKSDSIHHSMIAEYALIDALFGKGLSRELEGEVKKMIAYLTEWKEESHPTQFISIDVPSGLNANFGEKIGEAVLEEVARNNQGQYTFIP